MLKNIIKERLDSQSMPGNRSDGRHISLVIEGGNMRGGTVGGGMVSALQQLKMKNIFDSVYGASSGSIAGAYFLSDNSYIGASTCYQNGATKDFINFNRALKGLPVADLNYLIHQVMGVEKPLDWEKIALSNVDFYAAASCCISGKGVALKPSNKKELLDCLHASSNMPFFAGKPKEFKEGLYFDACIATPFPIELAKKKGATDLLVLKMSPGVSKRSKFSDFALKTGIRPYSKALLKHYVDKSEAEKSLYQDNISVIKPDLIIPKFERNLDILHQGVISGFNAVYNFFDIQPPELSVDADGILRVNK